MGIPEDHERRMTAPVRPVPVAFSVYTGVLAAVALVVVAVLALTDGWGQPSGGASFWVLAGLVFAGELVPIQVPRRYAYDRVTMSSAFVLALLMLHGALPALAVYVTASLVADRVDPTAAVKAVFNAAHYALA